MLVTLFLKNLEDLKGVTREVHTIAEICRILESFGLHRINKVIITDFASDDCSDLRSYTKKDAQ